MRKALIALSLLAALLLLGGCGIWNPVQKDPKTNDFYQGSEGVMMRFVPGSPPPRMYYYADDTTIDNRFDVSVELHNMGASDAIGALYISGYSPNIIEVKDTDLTPLSLSDCAVGFGNGAFGGAFDFLFNCAGMELSAYGTDRIHARIDQVAKLFNVSVGLEADMSGDQWSMNFMWDKFNNSWDVFNHGRALVLLLSALDFKQYNGYPFNGGQTGMGNGVLRGDNHFYPGGEYGFQNFEARVYDWPQGLDEVLTTFQVDSCYGYATYAAPLICVDPHPFDDRDKVCTPHEYTWSGSQGAPVAITSLKQDPTPRSIFLTFTIRNVGRGDVIHPGYLERCSPYFPGRFDERFKNVVYIGDIRIGHQRLTCTPGYEVRLQDGVGTFTCEYRPTFAGSANAYETPVIVELWYGYHDYIKTQTLIKRAG